MSKVERKQIRPLNERHGYFQFGDAQGDVSLAFANELIEAYESLRGDAYPLLVLVEYALECADNETIPEWDGFYIKARALIAKHRGGK